jgi:endonuclease YncB( thermonuclease family)
MRWSNASAIIFLAIALPSLALAHGGGLDAYGCHDDHKAREYHCHQGDLAGMTFVSKAMMLRADDAKPMTQTDRHPAATPLEQFTGRVISVTDGDTISVLTQDKQRIKIHLYGIDTPESGQPFGTHAKQATSDAVFGKNVQVQPINTDLYGRVVAVVSVPGDRPLNESLVDDGLAWVYPQSCKVKAICEPLRQLEAGARAMKRGLWADKSPVPPWQWREQ